jgi:uncharacterized protein (DUF305 family)
MARAGTPAIGLGGGKIGKPHGMEELSMDRKPTLAVVIGGVVLAAAAYAHDPKSDKPAMGGMAQGSPSMQMHMEMMSDKDMKMPMSGSVDKDFAAMMIMHHQQAIRMADVEIANGKDQELKAMASKMRQQQLDEIEKLKQHR